MQFTQKLTSIIEKNNSLVCVGLDTDKDKIPAYLNDSEQEPLFIFNKAIIDATKDIVCAYKLNMAFYEIFGTFGFALLEKTIACIPNDVIIILDGKRNDIGNTADKYAQTVFKTFNADATTVNPYLGIDGVAPFLQFPEKCSFILCRTSNKSAGDFQDLLVPSIPLYQAVAQKIKQWNTHGNCGAVVGATYPDELRIIRSILGETIPLLIPGVGRQGGDIEKTIEHGTNRLGSMAIINSSRDILYAGTDETFAEDARKATLKLRDAINRCRKAKTKR